MRWAWKIASVAGIDVCLHITFLVLIAWIGLACWQLEGALYAVVGGVGFILAMIGLRYNLFLVLIAIFIWIGAATEASVAGWRSLPYC